MSERLEEIKKEIGKVMSFGTNEEVYEAIQDAIKALEGETMKTLVSVNFNGTSNEHIFDVPKDKFKIIWDEQVEQVGYFEGIDTEGKTVIINPKQCPVIVMYDLKD